jgi:hypothetical protein
MNVKINTVNPLEILINQGYCKYLGGTAWESNPAETARASQEVLKT